MTKAQKIIILIATALIVAAILYPPYLRFVHSTNNNTTEIADSGWDWINKVARIDTKSYANPYYTVSFYSKIRLDIFALEIFGIIVTAGVGLLISKKR